jgi:hypothetical protein
VKDEIDALAAGEWTADEGVRGVKEVIMLEGAACAAEVGKHELFLSRLEGKWLKKWSLGSGLGATTADSPAEGMKKRKAGATAKARATAKAKVDPSFFTPTTKAWILVCSG